MDDGNPWPAKPVYTRGGVEAIEVIEAWALGFNLGNVIKYLARAGDGMAGLADLKKAQDYLTREIHRRVEQSGP